MKSAKKSKRNARRSFQVGKPKKPPRAGRVGLPWTLRAGGKRGSTRIEYRDNDHEFDELYVGDWFAMEQMDDRVWWFCVAGQNFSVEIPRKGEPTVRHYKLGILKGGE